MKALILLFFLLTFNSFSQLNSFNKQFQLKINYAASGSDKGVLTQLTDNSYVLTRIFGETLADSTDNYAEIIRMDIDGDILWSKKVFLGRSNEDYLFKSCVVASNQNEFYFGVNMIGAVGQSVLRIAKINSNGTIIWSKILQTPRLCNLFTQLNVFDNNDLGFLVEAKDVFEDDLSNSILIGRIDANGTLIYGNGINMSNQKAFSLELNEDEIIISRYENQSKISSISINSFYNSEIIILDTLISIQDLIIDQHKNKYVCGLVKNSVTLRDEIWLAKIDSLNNVIWSKKNTNMNSTFNGAYANQLVLKDSEIFAISYYGDMIPRTLISRFDINGNILSSKSYYFTFHTFNYERSTLIKTNDNQLAFASIGGVFYGTSFATVFQKLDDNNSSFCDGTTENLVFDDYVFTTENNILVLDNSFLNCVDLPMILEESIVLDSVFCENIEVEGSLDVSTKQKKNCQIYPNPLQDKLRIESEFNIQKIEIFNLNNELVHVLNYFEFKNSMELELHFLEKGYYLIRISSNSDQIIKKLLKE